MHSHLQFPRERGLHYYVFQMTDKSRNIPEYVQTVGRERVAKKMVEELDKKRGVITAFYTIDHVPKKFWY